MYHTLLCRRLFLLAPDHQEMVWFRSVYFATRCDVTTIAPHSDCLTPGVAHGDGGKTRQTAGIHSTSLVHFSKTQITTLIVTERTWRGVGGGTAGGGAACKEKRLVEG